MKSNGYSRKIITPSIKEKTPREESTRPTHKTSIVIPYYKGLSKKIRRIGNNLELRTAVGSQSTRRRSEEDTAKGDKLKGPFYIMTVSMKSPVNVEENTLAKLGVLSVIRISEHKRKVRNGKTEYTRISKHVRS